MVSPQRYQCSAEAAKSLAANPEERFDLYFCLAELQSDVVMGIALISDGSSKKA